MSQADSEAAQAATGQSPQQKRLEERVPVHLDGPTLRHGNHDWATIALHDLSSQGFRADWQYKLAPGDEVWLKLPGLDPMPAKVAWELDYMIGCKFDVALHPAVFAKVLDRIR